MASLDGCKIKVRGQVVTTFKICYNILRGDKVKIPVKINYNGTTYNTIKLMPINGYNFLIVEADNTFVGIDVIEQNENISFIVTNDIENMINISEHILIEYLVESLNFHCVDRFKVKDILDDFNSYINNGLNKVLSSCNEKIKDGDFNHNVISLLEYFDEKFNDKFEMKFKNLIQFKIGNRFYIKDIDVNGKSKISIMTRNLSDEIVKNDYEIIEETISKDDLNEKKETRVFSKLAEAAVFSFILVMLCGAYLAYLILDII